ncbi:basic helix-loop-helix (bHLH) DNA-binding superfamily protein [Arabidopsis thaliana]|jgi:K+/H+ antiporter YhaU regulatory subunit KhtT|uniref:Transcription factor HFR1 n=2 Tax=Arabidopsis thaliana TaxID=3702 RepID=HFR1_ARATH|nr:basic helix-loop-helix (bHLH) DNA-binding superfamily protein [Arabidopsis thaliana]Q9FE22.1 RecName: Full=Transcription factor HFR1; AltName: Full=Basic helix-loop-helix protein 26; Short=AtbHLH26; Short=bHLH 26; AltName: Full=Protein LONG HYPOCOTYL IN FAR-RED 1; AltName: Full=Protein REDUCED PHYTOCHROME SIGNALING; AltName: Full=Reduced sensitivity to far-red light; AltName: Full=Transcription factor EN 68; AltName: Full=bHLH transcription factor bHLH026 [Arabidopsis thaliana]AAG40617.1 bHLH-|eukprot:NP_563650.1 basic helix-loop-helix (bHLH) DNA-binding superfamily protein [Arabidopsis thaliana]
MSNNQAFMELGWRNDVGSLAVKDQGMMSERARSDEDRLINGLKWGYGYFDHDQTDNYLQIVPEIHKEVENAKEDLLVVVPDEHSETDDHHHIKDFSERSDHRFYLRNKHENPKKRRIQVLSSDDESEEFTREVPSVTRKGSKRRRRDEKMSNKMRKLQQLVPNCHKTDKVSVLDKTIEYMKNLQLQLQMMSTVGVNPYFLPATLGFGMHNHMLTAMASAHGLNPANHMMPSPLIPALNWPLPPFTNISFPHSSSQSLFLTTSSPASSPQSLHGLVPYFPSFLDFSSHAMRRL